MMRYRSLASLVALAALVTLPALAAAQNRPAGTPSSTPTPPGGAPGTPAPPAPGRAPGPAAPANGGAASPVTSVPSGLPLSSEYVIGPGDVLQISVWKNESLSRLVPVRPDGKISMPLLHDVQAAGLTAMQLRDKIARALAEFLPNPEVSVSVTEVRSMRVSVLGEVMRPGVLELRGTTTILEAIAMAGGFRDFASPSKIMVIRTDANGRTEKIRFNYNRAVGGDEQNLVLKPGDVIVVP